MSEFSGCQEERCHTANCRRAQHHGAAELGLCPRGCKDRLQVLDYSHVIGVGCTRCGAYWIPEGINPFVLANAHPWERGKWSNVGLGAGRIPDLTPAA